MQLLNLGGVIGICDSINPSHGDPFNCKVLGCVLDFPYLGQRVGVPARVSTEPLKLDVPLDTHGVPVVAIAGTCMNSGQDGRGMRDRQPVPPQRPHRRRNEVDRRRATP